MLGLSVSSLVILSMVLTIIIINKRRDNKMMKDTEEAAANLYKVAFVNPIVKTPRMVNTTTADYNVSL